MSVREKSAWVMALLMALAGAYYGQLYIAEARSVGWAVPPAGVFISYTIFVIVGSIVAQTAIALLSPKEAELPADERERPLLDRAGNWSGLVLGGLAVCALFQFMVYGNGNILFHLIVGSLILSQIAEYAFQAILLHRSA